MTLSSQIKRLSDEELLHEIAGVCGWERVVAGDLFWYVDPRNENKIVSGSALSLDMTIANAVKTFDRDQETYFADYVYDATLSRFTAIQASVRIKAEAVLFAHSKFCP